MNIQIPREIIGKLRGLLRRLRSLHRMEIQVLTRERDRLTTQNDALQQRLENLVRGFGHERFDDPRGREFCVRISSQVLRCVKTEEERNRICEEAIRQCVDSALRAERIAHLHRTHR